MASRGYNLIDKKEAGDIYSRLMDQIKFIETQPNENIQEILESYESELIPGVHVHFNGKYIWLAELEKNKFYRTNKTIENMLCINTVYSNVLKISRKQLIQEVEKDSKNDYNSLETLRNDEKTII